MNQPMLLEVERDMSRARNSDIKGFKRKVGIWTHNNHEVSTRDFPKWMAMLLPVDGNGVERYSDHRSYCNSDDPFEIIAGYCQVILDSERATFGHTEREAIKYLCELNSIPCDL